MGRAFGSLKSWVVDWLIGHWPTIVAAVIGGGGMAYLASASAFLNKHGPVAWGAVGLSSFLVLAVSLACVGYWKERSALADFARKSTLSVTSNPLSPVHSNERIQLIDFFHPYYKPLTNIRFENCDLMGPASVYSEGGTFDRCGFNQCEVVIVRTDRPVIGGIHLRRPTLVNCNLYRITFLMPVDQFNNLPAEMKSGVPVISDGRVGDI